MLTKVLIFICLLSKTSLAQINGEFWWLSDKVAKLKGIEPPPPKIEELSEFDTDESAKIIFRDPLFSIEDGSKNYKPDVNSLEFTNFVWPDDAVLIKPEAPFSNIQYSTSTQKILSNPTDDMFKFIFPEDDNFIEYSLKTGLSKPTTSQNNSTNTMTKVIPEDDLKSESTTETNILERNKTREDSFSFVFPVDDDLFWVPRNTTEGTEMVNKIDDSVTFLKDETSLSSTKPNTNSESICSFIKKNDCYRRNGIIYNKGKFQTNKLYAHFHLVCCIIPLSSDSARIVFPDSSERQSRRFRRSNKQEPSAKPTLSQRDFLLRQKFRPQNVKAAASQTRVVTPSDDEYVDPYWNIKSSNFKKPGTQGSQKQDCDDPDYVEDYVVELPRPGLIGLYSDNPQKPSWSFESSKPSYGATIDYSDEDEGNTFVYSTIDPRRSTSKAPKRGRPVKLTTSSPEEDTNDPESQTVTFQSNPNFQVLQGFKLLNLGRNKNKFYSKNTRRSTTEGSIEIDSKKPFKVDSGVTQDSQVFVNCGKTANQLDIGRNDKQFGEAASGSHPWMALVVLTRRPQGILCYATIVHPRAAVTAGDCVYGRTAPKEILLVAGLWNLNDRSRAQNRFVTITLHPQFRPKILAHDLALLHWKTPLRLNVNVQSACLGTSQSGEDCRFFGWGGFDQGVRPKPRWQRASILPEEDCAARLSKSLDLPDDGFCATVQTRGTVTGMGGPLICDVEGRNTAAGVSVWRDNALVLIPAHEWIVRAFEDLRIE